MARKKKRKPPTSGTVYKKRLKGVDYTLTVVETDSGVAYEHNGKIFKTPTAAAKSIVKYEVNGPAFWGIDECRQD